MLKRFLNLCSVFLVLALLVNMVPVTVFAQDFDGEMSTTDMDASSSDAYVLGEVVESRTEYSKEFRLSNGLHLAAVYQEPVHYEKDGKWADIDNTLAASTQGYANTAGSWDVCFPQTIAGAVSVTQDGYTLSFRLAGELRPNPDVSVMSADGGEALALTPAGNAQAQLQPMELSAEKESAQYPETVLENNHSRLLYPEVFGNASVVYDLVSNRIKESIVIEDHDSQLRGYRYTLNTGGLIPELTDSGDILLYGSEGGEPVFLMPAPYLADAAGEYSFDATVALSGSNGVYTLTYTLPQEWMAEEDRAYPVILDPMVQPGTASANISDITVAQKDQSSISKALLNVGIRSNNGVMRGYVMFKDLPQLDPWDIVVEADFSLYHISVAGANFAAGVHKVGGAWDESTITWASKPQDNEDTDIIRDFNVVDTNGVRYSWDVTEIVRDWYLKGNTGLCIRAPKEVEESSGAKTYLLQFAAKEYSVYQLPALTIAYRTSIGVEDYNTYTTLGVGNAGGVYLSDNTGQITVVREIAAYASTINPFSMNMVYNSAYFLDDGTKTYSPLREMGLSMDMGNGWTLDMVQKLEPITIGSLEYLKYYDGDGTIHYFQKSGDKYYDEDGLGLSVVLNADGSYTMSDTMDNQWFFTALPDISGCFLTGTKDNNGNRYTLRYENGKLKAVMLKNRGQSSIVLFALNYQGDRLSVITDASQSQYYPIYSGNYLVRLDRYHVTNGRDICAYYSYAGGRMTAITDYFQEYTLHFAYGQPENGARTLSTGRVISYWETYRENGTEETGVRCDISYPSYTQTTCHSYGNDRVKGSADDLYTHYLFDYAGRTVNAYTTNNDGTQIWGASTVAYTDNEGIKKTNNRTLRTAAIGIAAQNLLTKGNFEDSAANWTYSGAARSTADPHTGVAGMKGTLTTSTTATASRKTDSLTAGQSYTVSAYVKTAGLSSFQSGLRSGVYLKVVDAGGNTFYSDPVNYATSANTDNGWTRIAVSFIPKTSGAVTVSIVGQGASGTFYADDVQLEKSEAPSNYNLLENSNMETSGYGWTLRDRVSFVSGVGVNSTASNAHAIQIVGDPTDKYSIAYQTVPINQPGSQTYVVSGWGKADSVTDNITIREDPAYDHTKQFGIRATVYYKNDSAGDYTEWHYVPFNADVSAWQYASMTITPRKANMVVDHITISLAYESNVNTAWFDDISLVCTTVREMEYDANGKPIAASSTGLNGQDITYDANGNVKAVTTRTGTASGDKITYTYTYDSTFKHRLLSSTNGATTETQTYDMVGNVTSTTLKGSDGKVISVSSQYTDDYNRLASTTDAAGNTTTYSYDQVPAQATIDTSAKFYTIFGIPASVTDAKGTQTSYVTDTYGRIREIYLADMASLKYHYSKGRLEQIVRTASGDPQTYKFNYDGFDNTTSIQVGNGTDAKTLASYLYGANNGLLLKQTFGNGDAISYTYDTLGRAKTTTYSEGRVLTYTYTGDGQLYSIHDSKTGYTYQYDYDSLGRLIGSALKNGAAILLRTRQEYNANNQMTSQTWQMGSATYTQTFTYSKTEGYLTAMTTGIDSISLSYDALRRLSKVDTASLDRYLTYRDIDSTKTTTQVSTYRYANSSGTTLFNYGYTYDELGNIATYNENGTTYTYTYDAQNQLLKQTGGGKTYTYTYDNGGNILTASNGTTTHQYTYGDAVWKDLLTQFDGQTISYDGSGNPISYYNGTRWSFTWEEGRRLTAASAAGKSLSFTYDGNGIRTSKTVDGVKHDYLYASGKLIRETWGSNTLDFFYDHNGLPYALKYNGTTYYYVTNLQGDVLHLTTASGSIVASYTYDPYGKPLTATGSMSTTNPLRYRGYYYDQETGFYYASNRYYDPEIGRWVSPEPSVYQGGFDIGAGLIGKNSYAYCANNPVNFFDPSGEFLITALIISVVAGAAIGGGTDLICQAASGNEINWRSVGASALAGGVTGGLMAIPGAQGVALGLGQTMVAGGLASGIGYGVYNLANGSNATYLGYAKAMAWGALFAGVMYTLPNMRPTQTKSILSDKTYTNSTSKVDNYVSQTKGYNAAKTDFNSLHPTNVKIYQTRSGTTTVGYISGGKTVNLHIGTSTGGPTLEIYDPATGFSIKIRY